MLGIFGILLIVIATLLLLMSAVLAAEIIAAISSDAAQPDPENVGDRPDIVVLIAAHNEEQGIRATLDNVRQQMNACDRMLVVADNCTDGTAVVARKQNAEVTERNEAELRGKGYALKFGVDHLRPNPPDIVVILDADCVFGPNALDTLAASVSATGRPAQALDLIEVDPDAPLREKISAFAFRVKNFARFAGLKRLGVPCPLAGTGMAFPWSVIKDAPLATGDIVEDLKLGIDLAVTGHPAVFEPRAKVTSRFPSTEEGQDAQRRRWEHGHLATIFRQAPRLLGEALRQGRLGLMGMALDLLIPPLTLLALVQGIMLFVSAAAYILGGGGAAFVLSVIAMGLTALSVTLAWFGFGRDLLPAKDLIAIPSYIAWKIPMYLRAIYDRENRWVRSARQKEDGNG